MIPFHETRRGQWFFEAQLPKLITALSDIADSLKAPRPTYQLKAEVPENFLSDLYLGNYVPFDLPATDLKKELTPEIIAIQEQLRKSVSEDAWALIDLFLDGSTTRYAILLAIDTMVYSAVIIIQRAVWSALTPPDETSGDPSDDE